MNNTTDINTTNTDKLETPVTGSRAELKSSMPPEQESFYNEAVPTTSGPGILSTAETGEIVGAGTTLWPPQRVKLPSAETVTKHGLNQTSDDLSKQSTSNDLPKQSTSNDLPKQSTSNDLSKQSTSNDPPKKQSTGDSWGAFKDKVKETFGVNPHECSKDPGGCTVACKSCERNPNHECSKEPHLCNKDCAVNRSQRDQMASMGSTHNTHKSHVPMAPPLTTMPGQQTGSDMGGDARGMNNMQTTQTTQTTQTYQTTQTGMMGNKQTLPEMRRHSMDTGMDTDINKM